MVSLVLVMFVSWLSGCSVWLMILCVSICWIRSCCWLRNGFIVLLLVCGCGCLRFFVIWSVLVWVLLEFLVFGCDDLDVE